MITRLAFAILALVAACDHARRSDQPSEPRRDASPAVPEDAVSSFDHAAAYRQLLAQLRIADPGDRVMAYADLARGDVRCFALREGDGVRLKACVTPTGVVRDGLGQDGDWLGLLRGAPDAAAAAAWLAWLATDETPQVHAPRIPQPVEVLTEASADRHGYAPAHRAKVGAPLLAVAGDRMTLVAWMHVPGATAPVRWVITAGPTGASVERRSAVQLP